MDRIIKIIFFLRGRPSRYSNILMPSFLFDPHSFYYSADITSQLRIIYGMSTGIVPIINILFVRAFTVLGNTAGMYLIWKIS